MNIRNLFGEQITSARIESLSPITISLAIAFALMHVNRYNNQYEWGHTTNARWGRLAV